MIESRWKLLILHSTSKTTAIQSLGSVPRTKDKTEKLEQHPFRQTNDSSYSRHGMIIMQLTNYIRPSVRPGERFTSFGSWNWNSFSADHQLCAVGVVGGAEEDRCEILIYPSCWVLSAYHVHWSCLNQAARKRDREREREREWEEGDPCTGDELIWMKIHRWPKFAGVLEWGCKLFNWFGMLPFFLSISSRIIRLPYRNRLKM